MSSDDTSHEGSNVWEDLNKGYVPGDELDIHPSLSLYTDSKHDIDDVTYEVIRHRLWTINEEHGRTLENVSGSPTAYFGQDFNPTILSADGEVIFNGPYVQLFSPIAELQVKWILENRSDNPGIEPGDVFISNDPWVGSTHQPDVFFLAPLFVEDELFCWVSNTLHQYDIGGTNAGSFIPSADDVYDEPTPIPPIKVVENDEVREDLKQMYMRQSRMPNMLGLDFNAQVAGVRFAKERISDLVEEYGPRIVKGGMESIIQDSEKLFLDKLEDIPDGTWRARAYEEGAKTGEKEFLRGEIQLTKEGDTLTFRNEGTAANEGAVNLTYAGFRTAISCVINPMMMHDQLWNTSGAYRNIDIETEPGTINHAEFPSGVSCGGNVSVEFTIAMLSDVVSRMLSASDKSRDFILTDAVGANLVLSQEGIDQWGNPYATMNLDPTMGPGLGARTNKDGIDVGGFAFSPKGPLPNIEHNEQDYPQLYLYRRETKNGGGHGEQRGGAGYEVGFVPHKTDGIKTVLAGTGGVTPNTSGLAGHPGTTVRAKVASDSDVQDQLSERIPDDIESVDGDEAVYPPKSELMQGADDVMETRAAGGAGYGDPIKRDPDEVLEDVRRNLVDKETAYEVYGIVIDDESETVDVAATERRRESIVDDRLAKGTIPAEEEEV
jgi:N-methylhydantoinase B